MRTDERDSQEISELKQDSDSGNPRDYETSKPTEERSSKLPNRWEDVVTPPLQQIKGCLYNSQIRRGSLKRLLQKEHPEVSNNEMQLLVRLSERQDFDTGQLNVSNASLAKDLHISESRIKRTLKSLEEKGFIERKGYVLDIKSITSRRRQININWDSFDKSLAGTKSSMISDELKLTDDLKSSISTVQSTSSCTVQKDKFLARISQRKALPRALPTQSQDSFPTQDKQPLVTPPLEKEEKEMEEEEKEMEEEQKESGVKPLSKMAQLRLRTQALREKVERDSLAIKSLQKEAEREEANRPKFVPSAAALEAISKLPSLAELAEMAKKSPRFIEQQAEKTAYQEELRIREINERPFDKAAARLRRLDKIPEIYPNWKEVCDREQCTLNQLRRRMWANWQYEPFHDENQWWNPSCHPDYALMDTEERDRMFISEMELWMWPKPYKYSKRQYKMFQNTRARADSVKATYYEYVAAQYEWFGAYEINYERVCCKVGAEIYERWLREERGMPENHGNIGALNKKFFDSQREPAYRRKPKVSFEELLEQDRKELIRGGYCI